MSDQEDPSSRPTSKQQRVIAEEEATEIVEVPEQDEVVVVGDDGDGLQETIVSQEEKPTTGNAGENGDYSQENSAITSPQLEILQDSLQMQDGENGDFPPASLDTPDVDTDADIQEEENYSENDNEEDQEDHNAPLKPQTAQSSLNGISQRYNNTSNTLRAL